MLIGLDINWYILLVGVAEGSCSGNTHAALPHCTLNSSPICNRSRRLTDQRSKRSQPKQNETRATPPVDEPRSGQATRGKWDVTNTSRSCWPRSSWVQMLRKWDVSNATIRSWPEIRCWKNEDVTVMMTAEGGHRSRFSHTAVCSLQLALWLFVYH